MKWWRKGVVVNSTGLLWWLGIWFKVMICGGYGFDVVEIK
jgi:hypothetical protein